MPSQDLLDEIEAINAIYPESVKELTPDIYEFSIPGHDEVQVQMSFPLTYPEEEPSVIQIVTRNIRKYPDNSYIEEHFVSILREIFHAGEVVIFEFLGEVDVFLENYEEEHEEVLQQINAQIEKLHLEQMRAKSPPVETKAKVTEVEPRKKEVDHTQGWIQSDPVIDRGSTFIAFAREAHSVEEARQYFDELISDRKVAKSSHNMNTWRIKGSNGVTYQDCDDDGESAAGLRMLHLLTVCSLKLFLFWLY